MQRGAEGRKWVRRGATTAAGNVLLQQRQLQLQQQQQPQQQQQLVSTTAVQYQVGVEGAAGSDAVAAQELAAAVAVPGGGAEVDMLVPRGQKSVADSSDADLLGTPLCKAIRVA